MGAQVSEVQLKKILSYVEIGKKEGAKVDTGGERFIEGDSSKGYFMKPTLLVDVTNDMRVAREEIFGPVGVVIKFKTEEEVKPGIKGGMTLTKREKDISANFYTLSDM